MHFCACVSVHFCKPAIFRIVGLNVICMQFQIHSLSNAALLLNACVDWKGAIPDMIIKMIFSCGEAGNTTPRSIKPEPRKPLLPLALDMFMFQLHYVKQPPTHNVFVWVPLCKYECWSVSVCVSLSKRVWRITVLPERTVSRSHFSAGWFNRGTA